MWHVIWILPAILINYFLSCKCVRWTFFYHCLQQKPGNMVLHLRFHRNYSFAMRALSLSPFLCACECYVVCLRVCSGFTIRQTNNKSFLICSFVNFYVSFFFHFFFSTHSLCISVRLKQNLVRKKMQTEKEKKKKKWWKQQKSWPMEYCIDISVCLCANRDYWSW